MELRDTPEEAAFRERVRIRQGPYGLVRDGDRVLEGGMWQGAFLFSPALTIGGGTTEVQKNILGERILGLPKEPR